MLVFIAMLFVANGLLYEAYTLGARLNNTNPGIASSLSNMSLIHQRWITCVVLRKEAFACERCWYSHLLVCGLLPGSSATHRLPKEKSGVDKLVETDTSGRLHLEWLACCLGALLCYMA